MIHLIMIGLALGFAWFVRRLPFAREHHWTRRWQQAIIAMIVPPLLLLVSAIAVILMGPQGQMLGQPTGRFGYGLAWGFCGWAIILCGILSVQVWRSLRTVRRCPLQEIDGIRVRVLDQPLLFCAKIGFWSPEMVVTQGFLQTLTAEQRNAVFIHEQAHHYYRDTFWFFWLGWCRRLIAVLPNTEQLWQDLLLLRELRADQWAAQQVDPLLLAESLLLMVRQPITPLNSHCAAFSAVTSPNRLTERIEALLTPPEPSQPFSFWSWSWLLLILAPLLSLPFHQYF